MSDQEDEEDFAQALAAALAEPDDHGDVSEEDFAVALAAAPAEPDDRGDACDQDLEEDFAQALAAAPADPLPADPPFPHVEPVHPAGQPVYGPERRGVAQARLARAKSRATTTSITTQIFDWLLDTAQHKRARCMSQRVLMNAFHVHTPHHLRAALCSGA